MVLILITSGLVVLIIWLWFLIQGAPHVQTKTDDAEIILTAAIKHKPKRILDMGSGNGRIVLLLAKNGFCVDGIEINPIHVWIARRNIKDAGLTGKASIKWGSFWNYDVSNYDMVTMYAIQHIMPKLETKLTKELKPGSIVVSNFFTFPNKKPHKTHNRINVYKF
ncbi:MAG TPA: class I SAM-dependent methyltransferase [Candidatus Saccharimonadales bacterium]|nr:class I SAM-dependent methyltransferase [Candidatus Saccharimonadales bacterium]